MRYAMTVRVVLAGADAAAIAVIGGILASTVLSLVVTPVVH